MGHSILTLTLGIALCIIALVKKGWFYGLGWLGLNFVILGFAQIFRCHIIFRKMPDGTLTRWGWALFLPLHLYSLAVIKAARLLSREPTRSKVCDDLWVGSKPDGSDSCDWANVIDLTAEFQEPKKFRMQSGYLSFPILDAGAPTVNALAQALDRCPQGPTFIHCAQGHGRTGLFAAAWLLKMNRASTAKQALSMLTKARPGIRLTSTQTQRLMEFEKRLREGGH